MPSSDNERYVRKLPDYYCARCRKLRPEAEMVDDKRLGYICAEGCRK